MRAWEPSVEPIVSAASQESRSQPNGTHTMSGANRLNSVSEQESDVLEEDAYVNEDNGVAEAGIIESGITEPVGSGAPPAKMLVEPI